MGGGLGGGESFDDRASILAHAARSRYSILPVAIGILCLVEGLICFFFGTLRTVFLVSVLTRGYLAVVIKHLGVSVALGS